MYLIDSTKTNELSFNARLLRQTLKNPRLIDAQILVVATKQVNNICLLHHTSLRFIILYARHCANNLE